MSKSLSAKRQLLTAFYNPLDSSVLRFIVHPLYPEQLLTSSTNSSYYLKKTTFFALCRHLICGRKTVPQVASEDEDEDVATEHQRVSSGAASSDILQVTQLTKVYQHLKKKVYAVKRLSVGIPAGEVNLTP